MYICRIQQVVVDLVEILDLADEVRSDMLLAVELGQPPEHSHICVRFEGGIGAAVGAFGVNPLLDVDVAGAVVNLVGDVCCLGLDAADLTDEGYLGDGDAVDGEAGAGIGFFGFDELFDGYGAEGVVCELRGCGQ
jgi:hypothetical protein